MTVSASIAIMLLLASTTCYAQAPAYVVVDAGDSIVAKYKPIHLQHESTLRDTSGRVIDYEYNGTYYIKNYKRIKAMPMNGASQPKLNR